MPILTADNRFIENRILSSVVVLNAHPTLNNAKSRLASIAAECGTCQGKITEAEKKKLSVWNEIRQYLALMPDDAKAQIRVMLALRPNERVRIAFSSGSDGSSQIIHKEF